MSDQTSSVLPCPLRLECDAAGCMQCHVNWEDYAMTYAIGTPEPQYVRNKNTGEIIARSEARMLVVIR